MCTNVPSTRRTLLTLITVCFSLTGAASTKEKALAQAVRQESDALHKKVQSMIESKQFNTASKILHERGSQWLRQYGAKSWPMAEVSSLLADTYLACGSACDKEDEAIELYEKSASVRLEVYGERSPEYAAAIEKAADTLLKVGSYRRALPYFKKLEKGIVAGLGEKHDATRNVRMKLADCAMRAKSYKKASKTFSQLLRNSLAAEDEAHSRQQMALAMSHLGKNTAALQQIEAAKSVIASNFGKRDMRYARILNAAAGILERLNRDADALQNMQDAKEIVIDLFGLENPLTVQAKNNVEGLKRAIALK